MHVAQFVVVGLLLLAVGVAAGETTKVPVTDSRIEFNGRWLFSGDVEARADWSCSSFRFNVEVLGLTNISVVGFYWYGLRTRANATVRRVGSTAVAFARDFVGPAEYDANHNMTLSHLTFDEPGNYTVEVSKLTGADPFAPGLGAEVFRPSVLHFYGLVVSEGAVVVLPIRSHRHIEAIGASDTSGYCVDGVPDTPPIPLILEGWEHENCAFAYPGVLSRAFDASLSVQAIAGIGLVQNAYAKYPFAMGSTTMPGFINRTLQSDPDMHWDYAAAKTKPDVVLISLGGDDYNHQRGDIPANSTFFPAYAEFVHFLMTAAYSGTNATFISVCGMGIPKDPSNNRCHPCPYVEAGVHTFWQTYPALASRLHYIFVPCDNTVINGQGDIGCDGHKNRLGQQQVADFLQPKIGAIMNW